MSKEITVPNIFSTAVLKDSSTLVVRRVQRLVVRSCRVEWQDVGQDLKKSIGDCGLANSADSDRGANPLAAAAPPVADLIKLRAVLPVAGAEERVDDLVIGLICHLARDPSYVPGLVIMLPQRGLDNFSGDRAKLDHGNCGLPCTPCSRCEYRAPGACQLRSSHTDTNEFESKQKPAFAKSITPADFGPQDNGCPLCAVDFQGYQ